MYLGLNILTRAFALIITLQQDIAPEQGMCSFYAEAFHGRQTASGLYYNMDGMSVAHKTLPLGTRVFFANWRTMRFLILRVEDRGPYIAGREFDLSKGAMLHLNDGNLDQGVIRLNYLVLDIDTEGMFDYFAEPPLWVKEIV